MIFGNGQPGHAIDEQTALKFDLAPYFPDPVRPLIGFRSTHGRG